MCPQLVSSRDAPTNLELPVVPVDAAIPLTSPFCKVMDNSEVNSEGGQTTLQPMKESHTVGSDISDVSSHPSPDVEEVEETVVALASPLGQPELKPESLEAVVEVSAKSPCSEQGRRRSSHTWKGFSLKKQLSRVDQKFKHTFSTAPQQTYAPGSISHTKDKRSSVFYYSSADMPCTHPVVNPIESESPLAEPAEENASTSVCTPDGTQTQPQSDFTLCGTTRSNVDTKEQQSTDELAEQENANSQVLLSPVEDSTSGNPGTGESVSHTEPSSPMEEEAKEICETVTMKKVTRPVDLPLFDVDGKPVRPQRRESKKKSMDKREGRLLSVPNIKYSRSDHWLHDLRSKEDASSNQPSFGNLMRRLSKCAHNGFHCYTFLFCSLLLYEPQALRECVVI